MPEGFSRPITAAKVAAEESRTALVFVDFEAFSLSERSVPVEVGWAIESGTEETHVILPEPGWSDWSSDSEAVRFGA